MKEKLIIIKVKFRRDELDKFPSHKSSAGRVRLQCGLEPLEHGGARQGAFKKKKKSDQGSDTRPEKERAA